MKVVRETVSRSGQRWIEVHRDNGEVHYALVLSSGEVEHRCRDVVDLVKEHLEAPCF